MKLFARTPVAGLENFAATPSADLLLYLDIFKINNKQVFFKVNKYNDCMVRESKTEGAVNKALLSNKVYIIL